MANDKEDDAERVGYRTPPRASQFKPGQSGNPRGRPNGAGRRRSDDILNLASGVLRRGVRVRDEHGAVSSVPAVEALLIKLLDKGLKGDQASSRMLLDLIQKLEARREAMIERYLVDLDDYANGNTKGRSPRLVSLKARYLGGPELEVLAKSMLEAPTIDEDGDALQKLTDAVEAVGKSQEKAAKS